ncbi:hypothetical protein BRADI_2g20871v3 [Brachypodium distachyon]|uniref:Bifunctional inhibitor/plant lipid transfer protein/seed storage helical domain-containing protein n=1 Tax=Brachypodium distachyon TaxID=15368 RepID=A0A0Q3IIA0_BRADI|nr:hypothetical protein BRADI_2g20871v3 [Brachypodium distachyon]
MAKLVFFAVVVAALVAVSASQGEAATSPQCQRRLQESSLDACRRVVEFELGDGDVAPCCQQLGVVGSFCRAAAIYNFVRKCRTTEADGIALPGITIQPGQKQGASNVHYSPAQLDLMAAHDRLMWAQQLAAQLPQICGWRAAAESTGQYY